MDVAAPSPAAPSARAPATRIATTRVPATPTATQGRHPSLIRDADRTRLSTRAAVLLILIIIVMAFAVSPLRALMRQRAEIAGLDQQAALLVRANDQLHRQIAQLNDPAYVERLARECLGMSYPGETSFVLVPKNGGALPNDC